MDLGRLAEVLLSLVVRHVARGSVLDWDSNNRVSTRGFFLDEVLTRY